MINVNEFKPGITFEDQGNIYIVIESSHSKQGRGQANVKVKAKNLRSSATTILNYTGGVKVNPARIESPKMQYLYNDGESFIFMDQSSYEQVSISNSKMIWEKNFLVEEQILSVIKYEGEILGVNLPIKINLKIAETSPAVSGDTVGKATKDAYLETGYKIQVPLFISQDEVVIINTVDGKYVSRA